MKTAMTGILGVSLLVGLASAADAAPRSKKHLYRADQNDQYQQSRRAPNSSGYYEHLADKLPFGSSLWWEQMNRERRGGRSG